MIEVTILGCGGSLGVPMVGGDWGRCDPSNPRNRRRRPSILVRSAQTAILVDTTPDCRTQLLESSVNRLDAILFTHSHADHIHGLDDVRPLTWNGSGPIDAFADPECAADITDRFGYAVAGAPVDRGFYKPLLVMHQVTGPFDVGDLHVQPFTQAHGPGTSLGFRFGNFAYSTDASDLDDAAFELLAGVDTWVVDACREAPHPSHAHLDMTLAWIDRLRPRRSILFHMNHTMDYDYLCAKLPAGVEPAYDGMVVTCG